MDTYERKIVEAVKDASDVRLEINTTSLEKGLQINVIRNKRLAHEIALAHQNYFNYMERQKRKNEKAIL